MKIVVAPNRAGKRAWWRRARAVRDADERQRYLIVWYLATGESSVQVAQRLGCARATVVRVAQRYGREGEPGLWDHRRQNGRRRVGVETEQTLARLVASTPLDYGWQRPTWTQELLLRQLAAETGVTLGRTTLRRLLRRLRARRGRPRPVVGCPWPAAVREARLTQLRRLAQAPPPGSIVLYEDEVDIHLNPKIGPDWMLRGQQKRVVTPGQNVKRYLAGALNAESGRVLWVSGERKTSALFLDLLTQLLDAYPAAAVLHLILDNYGIHSSKAVQAALTSWARRIRLHFLPPYCPSANRIERLWLDLHAIVTRNHRHPTITELLGAVEHFLHDRNQRIRAARLTHLPCPHHHHQEAA
jgi:transposase